jgi:hypothetical protein
VRQAFTVDLERWPLVYIKPPAAPSDDANIIALYCRALESMLARRRPHVVLLDMRGARTTANGRRSMVDWLIRHDAAVREWMIALAVLASSELDRVQVTATFWSFDSSFHSRIFSDQPAAEHWLLSEYARHQAANHA